MTALIVGGGVAGLTAAMWLTRYGAPYHWVCAANGIGGMLDTVYNPIIDYPGLQTVNGPAAVVELRRWASDLTPPVTDRVELVRALESGFEVTSATGPATYPVVLLATGTRRRLLNIPGEAEGLGKWVLTSTAAAPERFDGRHVVLIGGGDAAVEGALNALDAGARRVDVVSRSPLRAQKQFVARFHAEPAIHHWPTFTSPTEVQREADGCRVVLESGDTIDADVMVVRIGVEPVRPKLDPRPRLDGAGYLIVDGRGETDVPGLFAAGDITSTPLRSIATSVGDGTRAARTIAEFLGMWS